MFPWIVEIFDLSPYHFYKVIEIIVREEDGLSRDVVKHLNHVSMKLEPKPSVYFPSIWEMGLFGQEKNHFWQCTIELHF